MCRKPSVVSSTVCPSPCRELDLQRYYFIAGTDYSVCSSIQVLETCSASVLNHPAKPPNSIQLNPAKPPNSIQLNPAKHPDSIQLNPANPPDSIQLPSQPPR